MRIDDFNTLVRAFIEQAAPLGTDGLLSLDEIMQIKLFMWLLTNWSIRVEIFCWSMCDYEYRYSMILGFKKALLAPGSFTKVFQMNWSWRCVERLNGPSALLDSVSRFCYG